LALNLVHDRLGGRLLIGRVKVGKTGDHYRYTCYAQIWYKLGSSTMVHSRGDFLTIPAPGPIS